MLFRLLFSVLRMNLTMKYTNLIQNAPELHHDLVLITGVVVLSLHYN